MENHDRGSIALAIALSTVAGYVDSLGFLHVGGFFIAFMSGNSTRLAVALANNSLSQAGVAGGILALFVVGVILGTWIGHAARSARRLAVLLFITALLLTACGLNLYRQTLWTIFATVLAMGAENAVFQRNGDISIGLTYMTGTLAKLGQRIAQAFIGGPRWAWSPYLLLWGGMTAGSLLGAWAYRWFELGGLWFAAGATAVLALALHSRKLWADKDL